MGQSLGSSGGGRRALVTGGTGFIGANLVRRLLHDGWSVDLLLRPEHGPGRIEGLRDRVRVHLADMGDAASARAVVRLARPDHVFHLAAHGAYSWQRDADEILRTNLTATRNLARAALEEGVTSLVHAGSSSEYGYKDHAPAEDEVAEPASDYAVTKAAATMYCRFLARREGLRIPTLRLYSAYGPWEDPRRLVPTLLVHALDGTLPPLAAPDTARDFVWVGDVVEALLLAAVCPLPEPGAIFNVGSGRQTRLEEIVDIVRDLFAVTAVPQWQSMVSRGWDTGTWVADSRRIRRELGWEPRTGLREGLRGMADWLRAEPSRLAQYRVAGRG